MRKIIKISPTITAREFRSASAAAEDMGISKYKFLRRLNKDGQVKDGGYTYVEPDK